MPTHDTVEIPRVKVICPVCCGTGQRYLVVKPSAVRPFAQYNKNARKTPMYKQLQIECDHCSGAGRLLMPVQ